MRIQIGKRIAAVVGRMPLEDGIEAYPMAVAASDAELAKLAARRLAHRDYIRHQSDVLLFGATVYRAA